LFEKLLCVYHLIFPFRFAKDRPLPKSEVGDLFVIHDTGAHSHSMGFQYNGKLRAPEVLIRLNGEDHLM
jgi:diaminopimelate decarboxylase